MVIRRFLQGTRAAVFRMQGRRVSSSCFWVVWPHVHARVYVCPRVCVCPCACVPACVPMCAVCTHPRTCAYVLGVRLCAHACVYLCVRPCVCVCVCVCACVYTRRQGVCGWCRQLGIWLRDPRVTVLLVQPSAHQPFSVCPTLPRLFPSPFGTELQSEK